MKIYARIEQGIVMEPITARSDEDGVEYPITALYHPDFVAMLVDITAVTPTPTIYGMARQEDEGWVFGSPTE
jgi:hypothetical protein